MTPEQMQQVWYSGTWEEATFTWDQADFQWDPTPPPVYTGVRVAPSDTNRPAGLGHPGGR
jgi:hypothetical protein